MDSRTGTEDRNHEAASFVLRLPPRVMLQKTRWQAGTMPMTKTHSNSPLQRTGAAPAAERHVRMTGKVIPSSIV